jgi:hypothetical protein
MNGNPTATGFSFEPLPDGNVRIEFHADDGEVINEQVITGDAFGHLATVVHLTQVAVAGTPPALDTIAAAIDRLADHFAPAPQDIVGTEYVARKLGCTPIHAARLARDGQIPRGCLVPGTGTGKPWKLYRRRVDEWLARR